MGQDDVGGTGAQHVGVVDVTATGHDGMDQGEHLAAWPSPTDPSAEAHGGVDQRLQAETEHQRAHEQEPGAGHQVRVVEAHHHAVDPMRYSTH